LAKNTKKLINAVNLPLPKMGFFLANDKECQKGNSTPYKHTNVKNGEFSWQKMSNLLCASMI
jgi:hypothetical protein